MMSKLQVLRISLIRRFEPDDPPELPEALVDEEPVGARGSGDLAVEPGGEEAEMIEVLDPVTGETTLIPKADSSFYDAGGYKARKSTRVFQNHLQSLPSSGKQLPKLRGRKPLPNMSSRRLASAFLLRRANTKQQWQRLTTNCDITKVGISPLRRKWTLPGKVCH